MLAPSRLLYFCSRYGAAQAGHSLGNVDLYTTDDYAARALAHYYALLGVPA